MVTIEGPTQPLRVLLATVHNIYKNMVSDFTVQKLSLMCMKGLVPKLLHSDQMGFVPTREAGYYTFKAIILIHTAHIRKIPMLLLSTDAEKAFDRVNWVFLMETVKHNGLGQLMMNWIQAIYS